MATDDARPTAPGELESARREVVSLREATRRITERIRAMREQLQRAGDSTTAKALREVEEYARELLDEVAADHAPTPSGPPPRARRSRRVSIEPVDPERARIQLVTEVVLTTDDGSWTGFSENLSTGGVFIAMWDPPPIGTAVRMEMEVPDLGKLNVRALVRWHRTASNGRRTGCGVSFDPSEAELVAKVAEVISHSWVGPGRTTVHMEDIP